MEATIEVRQKKHWKDRKYVLDYHKYALIVMGPRVTPIFMNLI